MCLMLEYEKLYIETVRLQAKLRQTVFCTFFVSLCLFQIFAYVVSFVRAAVVLLLPWRFCFCLPFHSHLNLILNALHENYTSETVCVSNLGIAHSMCGVRLCTACGKFGVPLWQRAIIQWLNLTKKLLWCVLSCAIVKVCSLARLCLEFDSSRL